MPEIRYNTSHHAGGTPEARVSNRLRNSGAGAKPDTTVTKGSGPTRTHTNIHGAAGHVAVRDVRDRNIKQTAKDKS
jgi:hypothetical protein